MEYLSSLESNAPELPISNNSQNLPKIKLPHTLEESWKLIEYPTSISDSDTDLGSYVALHPQRSRRYSKGTLKMPFNTMPFEHTRYQIQTIQMCLLRPDLKTSWGATLISHCVKFEDVGNSGYSMLVVDLADNGIFEKANIKCGDIIVGINGNDISKWTHTESEVELDAQCEVDLTIIPNKEQSIKYLLFLDLLQSDMKYIWSLNNLVSLHICNTKLKDGFVRLDGIMCKTVLQELSVTKCAVETLVNIRGLSGFRNLRRLNLNHNKLSSLDPDIILKLQYLEEIRLGNNMIETFPLVLLELPELKDVSLVYNLISQIPAQITRMKKLRNLHLDNNYLSEMPQYVTHQIPQLKGLTFSSNQLVWQENNMREFFHLNMIDFTENGIRAKAGLDNFNCTITNTNRATLRRKNNKPNKNKSLFRKALSA